MMLTIALAAAAPVMPFQQVGRSIQGAAPTVSSLGGQVSSPFAPPLSASVVAARTLEITLNVPSQFMQERFVVALPSNLQVPTPVLTLFHGYGEDPRDTVLNTALVDEALSRGWLVFAPLGAHHFNYGVEYSQANIEYALNFIGSRLPLDMDRIYGVGFSMGGGVAASYAARHLDPDGLRFAAIINHTGTTSLEMTYATSGEEALFEHPLMFGGTPDERPFDYRRCSTINLDPITGQLDLAGEMAPNLSHIPVQNWFAQNDVNQSIVEQTEALHARLEALGAATSSHPVASAQHTWSTLDAAAAIQWLEQQTLQAPVPGDVVQTLADRDGAWHSLEIEQRTPGDFTPVLWSSQPANNSLYLMELENAAVIGTDLVEQGLDLSQPLHVVTQAIDGEAPELRLSGFSMAPSAVQYIGSGTPNESFDPQTGTLTCSVQGTTQWAHWVLMP